MNTNKSLMMARIIFAAVAAGLIAGYILFSLYTAGIGAYPGGVGMLTLDLAILSLFVYDDLQVIKEYRQIDSDTPQ